jgi:hypothetical protein
MPKGKTHPELIILIHIGLSTETLKEKCYSIQQIYNARHRYHTKIRPVLKQKGFG